MKPDNPVAEINMAKIPVSGDVPGLLFTAGTMLIFFWGIPELRYMLPASLIAGCGVAVGLRLIHHEDRGEMHIFAGPMK
jgi:hypothetical protein